MLHPQCPPLRLPHTTEHAATPFDFIPACGRHLKTSNQTQMLGHEVSFTCILNSFGK